MLIDKNFKPIYLFFRQFEADVRSAQNLPFNVAVERNCGYTYVYRSFVFADQNMAETNFKYAERLVKTLIWLVGGYKIYIDAPSWLFERLKAEFSEHGKRAFDAATMKRVYEHEFEIAGVDGGRFPAEKKQLIACRTDLTGAKIGFDAGGSDRKIAAVLDGKVLFSAETVWHPKLNDDPDYHYALIKSDMLKAASYLPRIDKIGVSSAGIYVDNKIMLASLFIKVPDDLFENKVKNMYIDIARELNAPVTVANDGDVAALAGAMEAGEGNILGIAMGTSEAAGFIDADNNLWGWLNELAFVPVDLNESAAVDEWSGDIGTGVKYLSQDAVIKLAEAVGLTLDGDSPAQKLKSAQEFVREGNPKAVAVFTDIGEYLAYALLYYRVFYGFKNVLLMGRVASGRGGEIILDTAKAVLRQFEDGRDIALSLPDEAKRRVGQAVAAAAL